MLCVECGRDAPGLIGGSCAACFVAKTPLLGIPDHVDVELCAHCDARHVGAHWVDPAEDAPMEWIREEAARAHIGVHKEVQGADVRLEERPLDERTFQTTAHLEGHIGDTQVTDSKTFLVRVRRSTCDRCSRMFGGFYAAIIQLRATERDLTPDEMARAHRIVGNEMDRLRASGNRDVFLTKSERVVGGYDYYIGDIEGARVVARLLLDRLGATMTEHAKLVGRQEGRDVYRVTFIVRIRRFASDDLAVLDGEVVQVLNLDRGRAHVRHLRDGRTNKVDEERLARLGGRDVVEEAVVVSRDGRMVQVLDPKTLQTVDINPPAGWEPPKEGVAWVVRHDDELYLSPLAPPDPPEKRRRRNRPAPA
ncbi:MAG TPA: NMD3-related protein [Candidatus Thermoplasmatota archaeon]|nr:NMD3-related protein [Candidatus Thermoplasmatota archaeon]